jgi:hypothetical protein
VILAFEVLTAVVTKSSIFWDVTLVVCRKPADISEEHIASRIRARGSACYLLHPGFYLSFFFDPEDGGPMFL